MNSPEAIGSTVGLCLLSVFSFCVFAGCSDHPDEPVREPGTGGVRVLSHADAPLSDGISVISVDGIRCVVYDGYKAGGISCEFPPRLALCSTDASCEALEYEQ